MTSPFISDSKQADVLRSRTECSGRILVADDEPAMRRFIELGLRAAGYEQLIFCSNGSRVPAMAMDERPGLIIMDVMMPGGNGIRALRALKERSATAGIPVILTSGFSLPTLDECAQNRADAVIMKPFSARDLLQLVARLLARE